MQIILLSDTHSFYDSRLDNILSTADEIWHAGDIGSVEVVDRLSAFAKIRAVYGNIDSHEIRGLAPEYLYFTIQGLTFFMIHIAGRPPKFNQRVKQILAEQGTPDVLICGHSHILRVERGGVENKLLCLNPGAVGNQGFHKVKTLIKFELNEGQIKNMQAIELGPRASMKKS